jgi:hypothetical protein
MDRDLARRAVSKIAIIGAAASSCIGSRSGSVPIEGADPDLVAPHVALNCLDDVQEERDFVGRTSQPIAPARPGAPSTSRAATRSPMTRGRNAAGIH